MSVFPHEHAQCATWVKLQNKYIPVAAIYCGLDDSHGEDIYCWLGPSDRTSFFQNVRLGRKVSFQVLTNTLGFQSGLFFTTMRLRTVICHSCMKMFKEKKNKTSTKADHAFVSSA